MIQIGDPAPDMALTIGEEETTTLQDYAGKWIVLYFYPKDNTPGCTMEAEDFRDNKDQLEDLNAVVLGVSKDSIKSHCKFRDKLDLSFLLVSDENLELHQAFGTWKLKKMLGKEYMGTERSTFMINPQGQVVQAWRKVSVKGHVEVVLEWLKENQ